MIKFNLFFFRNDTTLEDVLSVVKKIQAEFPDANISVRFGGAQFLEFPDK